MEEIKLGKQHHIAELAQDEPVELTRYPVFERVYKVSREMGCVNCDRCVCDNSDECTGHIASGG